MGSPASVAVVALILGVSCLWYPILAWDIKVLTNPMCDSGCLEESPNLIYVSAQNSHWSMHFFIAASKILGPPSIIMVKSSKSNPSVTFDWKKLYDKNMYDGIKIENATSIYGLTYLSVIDFRDLGNDFDFVTASKSNKTFQEYYLSQLEYSLVSPDPDPATGPLQIIYRSDLRRRHKLLSNGGYIEIKVSIPTEDNAEDNLKAGQAFKSEISLHDLAILHPDSRLGVGIVLFSNLSLSPLGDFHEVKYLASPSFPDKPVTNRGSYVHLEEESMRSLIVDSPIDLPQDQTMAGPSQPVVLFHANSVGHFEQGESFAVLAGRRLTLGRNQRHRLTRSLAKALYGRSFDQSFQQPRRTNIRKPIGIRLQHFAFVEAGQKIAKFASWPLTLSMGASEKHIFANSRTSSPIVGIQSWGLYLINWLSSLCQL